MTQPDPDVVLSKEEFKNLVKEGTAEAGDTVVAVKREDWLPTVVELLNDA